MKIVKFEDGSYGIRRRRFPVREYVDIAAYKQGFNYSWSRKSRHFKDCKTDSLFSLMIIYSSMNPKYDTLHSLVNIDEMELIKI